MTRIGSRSLVVTLATLLATGWLSVSAMPTRAAGTVSLPALDEAYTQSFGGLATVGTLNSLSTAPGMDGWELSESGGSARDNELYGATAGSDANGDTYSYGPLTALLDRALGGLRGPALVPMFGASFTNNTGATIEELDIAYTGEMYRAGVLNRNAADRIDFQLSLDATSLTSGTWTDYDDLDFSSPTINTTVGSKDGNAAAFRTARSLEITGLSIANGSSFWIRWTDFDITGNDDGLAVDDFSLTPGGDNDVAPEVSTTSPADGDENVPVDANVSVTFSEPVTVTEDAFQVECTSSGTRSATVSGGPTTYTLDPDGAFHQHEYCTVTVDDAGVTDEDSSDPPDNMAADAAFTFRVANLPPTFSFIRGLGCSTASVGGSFLVNVSDLEFPADELTLALTGNTNTILVANSGVTVSGSADRTIAIELAERQAGTAVLTFTLSDGVHDVTFDVNVVSGSDVDDALTGTEDPDLILGYQGADQLSGLGGADVLCGGNGDDLLDGGDAADAISGDKGADTLAGGDADDALLGGPGGDTLTGGTGGDAFSGGHGGDVDTDFDAGDGDTSDGS